MHLLAARPTYDREQLQQYLDRLHTRSSHKQSLVDLEAKIKASPINALKSLQRKHLSAIPWGNIGLHYSQARRLPLDPDTLFSKIVERGLGGYCMEVNSFFANILRSLDYQLYLTGAKISNALSQGGRNPEGFGGFSHMAILVKIGAQKFHVDVGLGSQGPLSPILLKPGQVVQNVPGSEGRLVHETIAQATDLSQQLWIYQTRNQHSQAWINAYCFGEQEFFPEDFENLNFQISQSPQSWFTYKFVLTRVILDERLEKALGTVTVDNARLSRRLGGQQSETLVDFKSESERVEALAKWFDVVLREDEKRAIIGMVTEILSPEG